MCEKCWCQHETIEMRETYTQWLRLESIGWYAAIPRSYRGLTRDEDLFGDGISKLMYLSSIWGLYKEWQNY